MPDKKFSSIEEINVDQLKSVAGGVGSQSPEELIDSLTREIKSLKQQGFSKEDVIEKIKTMAPPSIKKDRIIGEYPAVFIEWIRVMYDRS